MVVPLVYGLFAGASAATPIVARALSSPAANKLINEGAKLVGRYPKNLAIRAANFFNKRLTQATQALAQDSRSGFVGTMTEGPDMLALGKDVAALGRYTLRQDKSDEDFPTNMEDVNAFVNTAYNLFDGITPEDLQGLIEDHLIRPKKTEEN
jgi:hypothetical protein